MKTVKDLTINDNVYFCVGHNPTSFRKVKMESISNKKITLLNYSFEYIDGTETFITKSEGYYHLFFNFKDVIDFIKTNIQKEISIKRNEITSLEKYINTLYDDLLSYGITDLK
jgi:hypothetical protein